MKACLDLVWPSSITHSNIWGHCLLRLGPPSGLSGATVWGGRRLGRQTSGAADVWGGRRLGRQSSGPADVWGGRRLGRQTSGAADVWGGRRLARHLLARHLLARHRLARHRLARHRLARHRLARHRLARHRLARHRLAHHMSTLNNCPCYPHYEDVLVAVDNMEHQHTPVLTGSEHARSGARFCFNRHSETGQCTKYHFWHVPHAYMIK